MKTEGLKSQHSIDLEPFYQALEDDPKLLEETLEILLGMVNFEPEAIKKLALFIKEDSRNLYNEIAELSNSKQDKGSMSSCCGGQ
ncbi:hypothetical protein [Gelidibacter sp.]|uniref:hypothetical protein n=1 Tax=Gelidibacter sp. TaxID=2018083 RepID=UPI002BDF46E2|nr:hypothetical protein [Gelidibacter sp.]HUH27602.1 hypothetical protein [Gelidibacter sp.]